MRHRPSPGKHWDNFGAAIRVTICEQSNINGTQPSTSAFAGIGDAPHVSLLDVGHTELVA
ncbi:hypothetical protein D9611_005342 [Ephemerocybe angulata]|uniref:Uncharacterized protein n=1 Tax=Ephemerocybe angulata TaxID=980116 RepID=A0A8H5C089_9AGAR|nr:hypothetical protein D9611_005342 [Tulosesus angulatus]